MQKTESPETSLGVSFEKTIIKIALPVTLQSLLQSSFSVIDQVMIGQLGSGSIAGIGLAGKFASLYAVVLAAIAAAAGIMISQYMGKRDQESVNRSFVTSLALSVGLAAEYLRILSLSFLPMAVSSLVTTMLRCMEAASLPLYASIFALFLNTGLNYLLIFGKGSFPKMGVRGAALASVIAQAVSCGIILLLFHFNKSNRRDFPCSPREECAAEQPVSLHPPARPERLESTALTDSKEYRKQYLGILCPLLICEFLWSLGENVYTAIYGNMGTDACAAMTMTVPVQVLLIGALSGLSQAAGILIGKSLGKKRYEQAYAESKKLMKYGLAGAILLSAALFAVSPFYVKIYNVKPAVQEMTKHLLTAFALIAPVKVLNMVLGGGIIRSGGKTRYVMWIDFIGTWLFGVPLGLLSAFVLKLPIPYVYFILSLEECVRLGLTLLLFRKRTWMESLK